jgi:hypothetical protein
MIYSLNAQKEGLYSMSWIYAHGELESKLGFDLVQTDDISLSSEIENGEVAKRIEDVIIWDHNTGIYHNCKMYLWCHLMNDGYMPRGLIVLADNVQDNACALDKYTKQLSIL